MKKRKILAGLFILSVFAFFTVVPSAYSVGWEPELGTIYTMSDGPSANMCKPIGRYYKEISLRFEALAQTFLTVSYRDNSGAYKVENIFIEKGETTEFIMGCVFVVRNGRVKITSIRDATNNY